MKLTSRLALGFAILVAATVGAVGYQVSIVQSLHRTNQDLSLTNLEAARISVRQLQGAEGVREFSAKYVAIADPGYRDQWQEWEGAVEGELAQLGEIALGSSASEQREVMLGTWEAYRERSAPLRVGDPGAAAPDTLAPQPEIVGASAPLPSLLQLTPERLALLAEIEDLLVDFRDATEELIAINEASVMALASASTEAARNARTIAWIAGVVTILVALFGWLFLYLSISTPLRRLTRGTRELARGRFEHRLEVKGGTELSALASDFNEMARKLGELEELKQDFVSHVSHELKGPLAAIQETILVFLEGIPGPVTERQRHLLELSRQSSDRLSTMIENLLEASRLEAGAGEYDPVPHELRAIATSVLEESEPVAEERGLRLTLAVRTPDTRLLCDGDRVREVISNLVGNALKFSPRGGRIRLTVGGCEEVPRGIPVRSADRLLREPGPFLLLSVEDEGPGIPPGHEEAIFEKFHQVDRERRIQGQGVGLGLAISKGIVEGHGGAIWVEPRSRDQGGAAFRTLLPVRPARWEGREAEWPDHAERAERAEDGGTTRTDRPGGLVGTSPSVPVTAETRTSEA